MDVGEMLRSAREGARRSQAEVASLAGTSQSAVARYETGAAVPSLVTLERLLAACGRRLTVSSQPAQRIARPTMPLLRRRRSELLTVARRHGARNVRVFGSTARDQARANSDIDLLVELEPGRTLLDLVALRRELSAALGRPVDVATDEMLSQPARVQAESEAVPL